MLPETAFSWNTSFTSFTWLKFPPCWGLFPATIQRSSCCWLLPSMGPTFQFSLFLAPHVFHLSCKALSSFQDRSSHTHQPLALLKPMWMVLSHVSFDWWIYSLLSLLLSSHHLDWLSQLVEQAVLPPRLQALKQGFSFVLGVSPAPQTTHRHLSKRDLLPRMNEWSLSSIPVHCPQCLHHYPALNLFRGVKKAT